MTDEHKIELMKMQSDIHMAYANYWIGMATSGVATQRKMFHGTLDGPPFTEDELKKEAMDTALVHIHRMEELRDSIQEMYKGPGGW